MYDLEQVKQVYNELTSKIKSDLDEQFTLGRITGSEYANVYSQLMNQCLQLAFQAPLQDAQLNKINEEKILIQEQQELTKNQAIDVGTKTELAKQETQANINAINAETDNRKAQKSQIEQQTELLKKQVIDQDYVINHIRPTEVKLNELKSDEILHNINLIDAQIESTNEDRALKAHQTDILKQDYLTKDIQNKYLEKQISADLEIKKNQVEVSQKQIEEIDQKITSIKVDNDVKKAQESLIKEQELETVQKIVSMKVDDMIKQTQSQKDALLKDAQRGVYIRQKQGFDDKMKMDLIKMQLDAWSMMFSSGLMCDDNGNCKMPNVIKNDELSTLYNNVKSEIIPNSDNNSTNTTDSGSNT